MDDTKHLFMHLLAICMFPLLKSLLESFAILSIELIIFVNEL